MTPTHRTGNSAWEPFGSGTTGSGFTCLGKADLALEETVRTFPGSLKLILQIPNISRELSNGFYLALVTVLFVRTSLLH